MTKLFLYVYSSCCQVVYTEILFANQDDTYRTGASGFIGGDFLAAVTKAHPEYAIRALARNTSSAKKIRDAFSSVEIVEGELDDIDTIRNEAADADVTLSMLPAASICLDDLGTNITF